MPEYPYYCKRCCFQWDNFHKADYRLKEKCPKCGDQACIEMCRLKITSPQFRQHWNENIWRDHPVFIRSRAHYRDELLKAGEAYNETLIANNEGISTEGL